VVGASYQVKGAERAFLWSNGQLVSLNEVVAGDAGWVCREARGINDSGQIVGWGMIKGEEHAFLISPQNNRVPSGSKKSPPPNQDLVFTAASASTVILTAPSNGAIFPAYPTNITLTATASDDDGVTNVQFFAGSTSVGNDASDPYSVTWSNVGAGAYVLTAIATDGLGISITSAPVNIIVDQLPTVSITSPANGSTFTVPTNIVVTATASDTDGIVSQVDFYAGTLWIGSDQSNPYSITWSNALAGVFPLTALAIDDLGGTTTSAEVYITNTFYPTNLSGLRLWLDPGVGVTNNGAGQISAWADQSGNTNNPIQATSSKQPLIVTNVLNGRRIVRFDGANDAFTFLNNPVTGMTNGEIFLVLKARVDSPASWRHFYTFGGAESYYPSPTDFFIRDSFGSKTARSIGDPSQPLDQYHLYNADSKTNDWSARLNGLLQFSTPKNTNTFSATPNLGGGGDFFDGDVAELLIYNRTLLADEKEIVGRYLTARYALFSAPDAPTSLTAVAVSSNQVSLMWSAIVTNTGTRFVVERKEAGGVYAEIARVDNSSSYLDGGVLAGIEYWYRVKAVNYAGDSAYSSETTAAPKPGQAPMPVNDLVLWLKADAGHSPGDLHFWADQSGRGNHAMQSTSTKRPQAIAAGLNGRPVVRFDGTNDHFTFVSNPYTGLTQGEMFVVLKARLDPASTWRSLGLFGTDRTYYPSPSGTILDSFGSTTIRNIGNPTQPLDQFHFYNVASKTNDWSARINGSLQFSAVINTNSFAATPVLGNAFGTEHFDGEVAEVLLYNRTLETEERNTVGAYLNIKYSLVALPTNSIQLTARVLSPTQTALSWRQAGSSSITAYTIERRLGTSGSFLAVAQLTGDWGYIDPGLTAETTYTYRVRNSLTVDASLDSNEEIVETFSSGADFPATSVAMWLRAEDIDATNNAAVSSWPDFLLPLQAAIQTNAIDRPAWITNGVNGHAAVQFGSGTFLSLPTVLSNDTPAEIFAVLRSVINSPSTNQGLWKFNTNGATYYPSTAGGVQDAFGSTNAKSVLAPLPDLTLPTIYNVTADTNLWRARLNGPIKQLLGTNTVRFTGVPLLGRSTQGASEPFAGFIAELIVFNRLLTFEEQKTVRDGFVERYSITLDLPHPPAGMALARTNTVDYRMSWTALTGSENGLESYFVVERQSDTNSPFVPMEMLTRTETLYVDAAALPEINYSFRLTAVNDAGETSSSALTAPLVDTDGDALSDYLESLLGTNPSSSDTDGDGLPDAWELKYGLNPRSSLGRDGASGDFDNDGLTNLQEYQQGSNPADGSVGDDPLIRLRVYRPQ
jgi:probable HAF family extracellular repeat protein